MTEQAKPPVRRRRWVTWTAITLAGLFGLLLVVVAAAYFALRSSLLQTYLIPRIAQALKAEGVELAVGSARLDLLSGLSLEGVQVRWTDAGKGEANIHMERLNLAYDIGLFGPELLIDEFVVQGVQVKAALSLPTAPSTTPVAGAEPASEGQAASLDLGALEALLSDPPLTIRVKRLRIEDVNLDLQLEQGGQRIAYRQQLRYEGEAAWLPGGLQARSRLELAGSDARFAVEGGGEGQHLRLELVPALTAEFAVALEERQGRWFLALEPLEAALAIEGFNLDQAEGGERLRFAAERFEAGLTVGARGREDGSPDAGLAGLFPLNVVLSANADAVAPRVEIDGAGGQLKVAVEPRYRLAVEGQVNPLADPSNATARLEQRLELAGLTLDQVVEGVARHLRIASQELVLSGDLREGRADASGDWRLTGVEVPDGTKAFDMHHRLGLRSDLALFHPEVTFSAQLDDIPLLELALTGKEESSAFNLEHQLQVDLPQRLTAYHPAAAALQMLGDQRLDAKGRVNLEHGGTALMQADPAGAAAWPVAGDWHLSLTQSAPPRDPHGVRLAGPLALDLEFEKGADYALDLGLDAKGIQLPPLTAALPLGLDLKARVADQQLSELESTAELRLAGTPGLNYRLKLQNQPQRLELDSQWRLRARPEWQRYLPVLSGLEAVGAVDLQSDLDVTLLHPAASVLELEPAAQLQGISTDARFSAQLVQTAKSKVAVVHLLEPLTLHQHMQWSTQQVSLEGGVEVPAADVDTLQARGLRVAWDGQARSGLEPKDAKARLRGQVDRLTALQEGAAPLELAGLVSPTEVHVAGGMERGQVSLDELRADVGRGLVGMTAAGTAGADGSAVQLAGRVRLQPRAEMLAQPAVSGTGSLELPWQLVVAGGEQLTLDGSVEFHDFELSADNFALKGVNGRLRLEEELRVTPSGIGFGYLVSPDPFQRVDFERIHPYLEEPFTLSAASIAVGEHQIGPFLADIPIRQNLVRVQRFNLGLFGGHVAGQLYLDATPGAWRVGLLGRASNIDLGILLPEKRRAGAGDKPVNARAALEFDIKQRLLDGRVDLTDMSRAQLLQLLDIMDPGHEDEQLASVRSALAVAYPEWVAMEMKRGLLTLQVAISTLPQPITVRGLPLTSIIQRFAGEALQSLDQLPLEQGS